MRSSNDRFNLKLLQEIDVKVGNLSNIITGCTILDNGKVLFSEFNLYGSTDRVTLNDSDGNYLCTVKLYPSEGSFYDITSINTNRIAVSIDSCISIVNIDTHNIVHKIKNGYGCCGITHCDDKPYYCSFKEGIRRSDLKNETNQLLVPTKDVGRFSYISCDGNKLFYTSNTGTVTCCDMTGKEI